MERIQPNSLTTTPIEDFSLDLAEINSSIGVFKIEIDKWGQRQDETSQKITDFLKAWLSLKEREKFNIEQRLQQAPKY